MNRALKAKFGRFAWLVTLVAAIWGVLVLNFVTGYALNGWFGLDPRDVSGLIGIPAMPFLHGSVAHAASNTPPLIVLGVLMGLSAPRQLWPASMIIVFGGGLAVWLLARDALHVGASGLVFGWFGYLIGRGVAERSLKSIAVATLVVLIYGTMVVGVLPLSGKVSWEAHLFCGLAGVGAAFLLRKRPTGRG